MRFDGQCDAHGKFFQSAFYQKFARSKWVRGIGTTSPTNLLAVGNNSSSPNGMASADALVNIAGWGGLYELWTTGIGGRTNWGLAREYVNAGDMGILYSSSANGTPNTTALYLSNSGNVGIGNTSPALSLQVTGPGGSPATSGTTQTGIMRIRGSTNNVLDIGMNVSTSPYGIWLQGTDATSLGVTYPIILQPNGGNVGIVITSLKIKTANVALSHVQKTCAEVSRHGIEIVLKTSEVSVA